MTTTETTTTGTPLSIPALRTSIAGRVITAGDSDYDQARSVAIGGGPDSRPAAIVKVATADDVAQATPWLARPASNWLSAAAATAAPLTASTDGGLVIDVSDMKRLDIDVEGRTAWADPGLTAGEYSALPASTAWRPVSATRALSASAGSRPAAASATSCASSA